ncbi:hypothetical protein OHR68_35910 [Spirillospora sp. NBC_00431]
MFQRVDERSPQCRPDLGQPVDGLLDQGCGIYLGFTQLEEPALDRFEEYDVPRDPTSITCGSYWWLTVRFLRAWVAVKQRPGARGSGAFSLVNRVGRGGVEPPTFRFSGHHA